MIITFLVILALVVLGFMTMALAVQSFGLIFSRESKWPGIVHSFACGLSLLIGWMLALKMGLEQNLHLPSLVAMAAGMVIYLPMAPKKAKTGVTA